MGLRLSDQQEPVDEPAPHDMIFPLFLFIAGVAMPFSLTKRLEAGGDKRELMLHVVRRGLVLVVLGVIYNNGLFRVEFEQMRLPSVLGRIGLAYMFAALIVLNTRRRGQVYWFVDQVRVFVVVSTPGA